MKKITALILAVLFIVALPAQTFATNEENEPEAFSSEKMLEKFPEADFSPTRGYGTIRKASGGKTLSEQSMTDKTIVPKSRYHTLDNEGDFYLDVYDDGSYKYYGTSFSDASFIDENGRANPAGETTNLVYYDDPDYNPSRPVLGGATVTYVGVQAFWSAGAQPAAPHQYMYFYFDYEMRCVATNSYIGQILRAYDDYARPGLLYTWNGYDFVPQGVNINYNHQIATMTAHLYDNNVNFVSDFLLVVTIRNDHYIPYVVAG